METEIRTGARTGPRTSLGSRLRRLLGPVAVAAVLGLLAVGLLKPRDPAATSSTPLAGKPAPPFSLASLDGGRVSLSDFKGRPVLVNFWASWCLPCRDEAPLLRQAAIDYADKGLVVLGVVFQDTPANARKFRDEFNLGFPSLIDTVRLDVQYGLRGVPESFFINRQGIIQSREFVLSAESLEKRLREIL